VPAIVGLQRATAEVLKVLEANPHIDRISILGHSLGVRLYFRRAARPCCWLCL
jgi:hypothetical protein